MEYSTRKYPNLFWRLRPSQSFESVTQSNRHEWYKRLCCKATLESEDESNNFYVTVNPSAAFNCDHLVSRLNQCEWNECVLFSRKKLTIIISKYLPDRRGGGQREHTINLECSRVTHPDNCRGINKIARHKALVPFQIAMNGAGVFRNICRDGFFVWLVN